MKLPPNAVTPLKGPATDAVRDAQRAKLRDAAHQLEGVFVRQLFEAMRKASPQDGPEAPSYAQSTFTSLLDDALAGEAAQRMQRGLGEALFRQLSRRLPGGETAAPHAAPAGRPEPVAHPAPVALPLVRDREGDAR